MTDETKESINSTGIWTRALYMLLFFLAYSAAEVVVGMVILIQLIITLFTGNSNPRLKIFAKRTSLYIYDLLLFLSFNTEEMPFPFTEWPDENR